MAAQQQEECGQCLSSSSSSSSSCTQPSCPVPELTPECTNQCLVLACDDPDHGPQTCLVTSDAAPCDGTCIAASACDDCPGLDEIFLCCTDYHSYVKDHTSFDTPPSACWEPSFSDLACECAQGLQPMYPPNSFPQSIQALISDSSISSSASSSPSLPPFSPQLHPPSAFALQPTSSRPFSCMWANCGSVFNSLSDLVGHVNLQHLCYMGPRDHPSTLPVQPRDDSQIFSRSSLSCHWGDCGMFASPSSVPASSSANSDDEALNILVAHLMQDHLGLNVPLHSTTLPHPMVELRDSPDTVHHPPLSLNPLSHDCSGTHVCKWKECAQAFPSCNDLTAHIASVHIGGGKANYDCFWEGCNRHGNNAFTSKQKISRHLQSHTGHRPFQCQVCNQNFSEAATLQQHMRRHTQEKPYVCDFPGCGKAFSITGALTIHKRMHNGQRPFKCKFCDKAFSESSNLSKHLRTHTGARPYVCTEEGCKKAFARPDQLARHANVHRKKEPRNSSHSITCSID